MSEVIVRMEMPKGCQLCPNGHLGWIYNEDGAAELVWFCNICDTEEDDRWISETGTERPSWCPIIGELPEQHGDLIDRDKLLKDIEMYHVSDGCFQHWCEVQKAVVPATERSET